MNIAIEHLAKRICDGEFKAVIFDLDGTVVDSMWMWKAIDIEYLARYHIPFPKDLQSQIEGMSFSETANYFKQTFQIPDSIDQMKSDWNAMAWDKYQNEVHPKEGMLDFLKYLKSNHIKTGIATSNSPELVEVLMESKSMRQYFDAIHTSCEVGHGKPAPDIYLHVAQRLGVAPDRKSVV